MTGNGTLCAYVWGGQNSLILSLNHSTFHKNTAAVPLPESATFAELRRLATGHDEAGLQAFFHGTGQTTSVASTPKSIGSETRNALPALRLQLPAGWQLINARLHLPSAVLWVQAANPGGIICSLRLQTDVYSDRLQIQLPPALSGRCRLMPCLTGSYTAYADSEELSQVTVFDKKLPVSGFSQVRAAGGPLSVCYRERGNRISVTAAATDAAMLAKSLQNLPGTPAHTDSSKRFRDYFWQTAARIHLSEPALQSRFSYALYKMACLNPPQGAAAQALPLSSAYAEGTTAGQQSAADLLYGPDGLFTGLALYAPYSAALTANRSSHLEPLWAQVAALLPAMQQRGEAFYNRKGALLFPSGLATGPQTGSPFCGVAAADPANTALLACLAFEYYSATEDTAFLRRIALPLLNGCFETYSATTDSVVTGGKTAYSFPCSRSPFYGAGLAGQWGKNAAYQSAACHKVLQYLPLAARLLKKPVPAVWSRLEQGLPRYAPVPLNEQAGIASVQAGVFEGQILTGSQPNPAHLAGIYPFSLPYYYPDSVAEQTFEQFTACGQGHWAGISYSLAACLLNPDAALNALRMQQQAFFSGGNALRRALVPGTSVFRENETGKNTFSILPETENNPDPISEFTALNAVFGMLLQRNSDTLMVPAYFPVSVAELQFSNLNAGKGLLISGVYEKGRCLQYKITSVSGGKVTVLLPSLPEPGWMLNDTACRAAVYTTLAEPGTELLFEPFRVKKQPFIKWSKPKRKRPKNEEEEGE